MGLEKGGKREESSSLVRMSCKISLESDQDSVEAPHSIWFQVGLVEGKFVNAALLYTSNLP